MEYVELYPGDSVILGEHEELSGFKNWAPEMSNYVGKEAKIVKKLSIELISKIPLYIVDIDGGLFNWRVANMTILKAKAKEPSYGLACKKCNEYYPYAEVKPNFICYGCRH